MRKRWTVLVAGLGLSLTAGSCKNKEAPAEAKDAARAVARAVCPKAYSCCTSMQLMDNESAGTNQAECERDTERSFTDHFAAVLGSQDQGRATFRRDLIDLCVATIQAADCPALRVVNRLRAVPGCERFADPLVATGQACANDWECTSGDCADADHATPGVCLPRAAKGASCATVECVEGLLCDTTSKLCIEPQADGTGCSHDLECRSGTCAASDAGVGDAGDAGDAGAGTCGATSPDKCFYASACQYGRGSGVPLPIVMGISLLLFVSRRSMSRARRGRR